MPPRLITVAIILGWLTTTGVLVYREVAPRFQAGEPPPFTIPLTAEVSADAVNWNVLQKDEKVGSGQTKISLKAERTFELSAKFTIKKIQLLIEMEDVIITGAYRVTEEGRLLSGTAKVKALVVPPKALGRGVIPPVAVHINFEGEVRDLMFHPKLEVLVDGRDMNPFPPEPTPVSESGSVLNPMHLVHKISGLRAGQSWMIPLMDPIRATPTAFKDFVPVNVPIVNQVVATVAIANLDWHGETVPCFKIEYGKPDERPLARTWVRRQDDAVLQQWASYEGMEYTLQRVAQK